MFASFIQPRATIGEKINCIYNPSIVRQVSRDSHATIYSNSTWQYHVQLQENVQLRSLAGEQTWLMPELQLSHRRSVGMGV